jgi:DNA-binding transcriptional regulator GbsR (MarR family)
MRRNPIRDDEQSFVDEVATLFAPWGLPPSSGRVYGYLLLCEEPVSVDQIAAALLMSRTGAWNSARILERFGHISRYGAPGSKRALYAASDNFAVPFLEQAALIEKVGNLMQTCASTIANKQAARRLENKARFWLSIRDAVRAAIEDFAALRVPRASVVKARSADGKSGAKRTAATSTLLPGSTLQKGRKKA